MHIEKNWINEAPISSFPIFWESNRYKQSSYPYLKVLFVLEIQQENESKFYDISNKTA